MKVFSIYNAKTHLSKLIQEAMEGEDIVIAKGKKPLVRLVIVDVKPKQRVIGLFKGKIKLSEDFDNDLDEFSEYSSK